MTLGDALMLFALVAAGVGAFTVEVLQRTRGRPRAWLYGWAGWSGVLLVGATYSIWRSGGSLIDAILVGLLVGIAGYPVLRATFWLRHELPEIQRVEAEAETGRRRYKPTDFGGPRQTPMPLASTSDHAHSSHIETPITPQPSDTKLARLSKPDRKLGEGVFDGLIIVSVMLAVAAGSIWMYVGDPRAVRESIGRELEAMGYPVVRITREGSGFDCPHRDDVRYRWRAPGAEGRACADVWATHGEVWVERIWKADGTVTVVQRRN